MNPMTYLDSILSDYASPKVRRLIHSILLLAVAIVTIVLAAEGDWKKALLALAAAVYASANRANTNPEEDTDEEFVLIPDEDVSGNDEALPF